MTRTGAVVSALTELGSGGGRALGDGSSALARTARIRLRAGLAHAKRAVTAPLTPTRSSRGTGALPCARRYRSPSEVARARGARRQGQAEQTCLHRDRHHDGDERADHPRELEARLEAGERPPSVRVGSVALHDRVERELAAAGAEPDDEGGRRCGGESTAGVRGDEARHHHEQQDRDEDALLGPHPAQARREERRRRTTRGRSPRGRGRTRTRTTRRCGCRTQRGT